MPKVTVDGIELDVPQGATVLQACELVLWIAEHMREAAE